MARTRVCILGESPLVEEYASLCLNKGFDVCLRLNAEGAREPHPKLPRGARKVSRPPKNVNLALELTNISAESKQRNLVELDAILTPRTPVLSSSVTLTVSEQSAWLRHPQRLVGIGALPSLLEGGLIEFAYSPATDESVLKGADQFARDLGKEPAHVQDSVGLVLPRILCMLVNEAYFALTESVALPDDIDTAMKLGTNYPFGPVEWAERIGLRQVYAVVSALHRTLGEDRYRAAPMLQKAAALSGFDVRIPSRNGLSK
ncbi:3-hydroxybutyryl-CoA dehydrogenase [bacterium]|nr:MAG: 3-hydroxybutyryl-CoA dehydrogenase [bacterium]